MTMAKLPRVVSVIMGNEGGGARESLLILAKYMDVAQRPSYVALGQGPMVAQLADLGIHADILGTGPPPAIHTPGSLQWVRRIALTIWNTGWVLRRGLRLGRYVRRHDVSIVHCNPGYPIVVAVVARWWACFSLVCHWRGIGVSRLGPFVGWLGRRVDRFIAISEAAKQSLPKTWQAKTDVIYNAVAIDRLLEEIPKRRGELHKLAGVSAGTPLIVCIATYAAHKGQHLLVEALSHLAPRHPKAVGVFMGNVRRDVHQQYLDRLKQDADRLGITEQCRFLKDVASPAALLADATITVVPTFDPGEGFGLVMAESMIAGVPVVAFDAGAAREVIEHGRTGLLVPDQDTAALADALCELLGDPEHRKQLGQRGPDRVRKLFDPKRVIQEVLAIYDDLGQDGTKQ